MKLSFGSQNFHIFKRENWLTFARSVQYWQKSDRIIFSNILLHCCCCFELPTKISHHYEEFHLSYNILSIFFLVKHPTSLIKMQWNDNPKNRISPRYHILKHDWWGSSAMRIWQNVHHVVGIPMLTKSCFGLKSELRNVSVSLKWT